MWSERSLFFQRVFIFQQILFFCWAAAAAGSGGHQPQFYFQLKTPPRKITYFLFLHFCLPSKQILSCLFGRNVGQNIPYICHFFYTDRVFENQILHPNKGLKAPKTLKMSLKKSNICIFFTQSGKIYT